jgi:hypothetical protein
MPSSRYETVAVMGTTIQCINNITPPHDITRYTAACCRHHLMQQTVRNTYTRKNNTVSLTNAQQQV